MSLFQDPWFVRLVLLAKLLSLPDYLVYHVQQVNTARTLPEYHWHVLLVRTVFQEVSIAQFVLAVTFVLPATQLPALAQRERFLLGLLLLVLSFPPATSVHHKLK